MFFREKREKVPFIRQNIHESIYDIVSHMDKIDPIVELANEESVKSREFILNIGPNEPSEYTDVSYYISSIKRLQKGPKIFIKTI